MNIQTKRVKETREDKGIKGGPIAHRVWLFSSFTSTESEGPHEPPQC